MTDPLGQSQVIPYIKGLTGKGYEFTLISCEKPDMFKKYESYIRSILKEANIKWEPIFYHKNPKVLSTIYDFYKLRSLAVKLHKSSPFELIHCRSYISSLIGLHLKNKYKIPFIFDMRGFWADERVDGGLWNMANPIYKSIYRFFKQKEYQFLSKCAAVVSLTEAGKKEMLTWEAVKKYQPPIFVIPCSTDFELFVPPTVESKNRQKLQLGIKPQQFVLSYLGSIGTWYLLPQMLDFFKSFLERFPDAVLFFLTPDKEDPIRTEARIRQIPDEKIIVRFAPRKEVAKMLSASDASIFFIKPSYSKLSSSPTKLGELLAMGLPVVCNSGVGDVKELVELTNGGVVIHNFKEEDYQRGTTEIKQFVEMKKQPLKNKVYEYFNLEKAIDTYYLIYKSILKN